MLFTIHGNEGNHRTVTRMLRLRAKVVLAGGKRIFWLNKNSGGGIYVTSEATETSSGCAVSGDVVVGNEPLLAGEFFICRHGPVLRYRKIRSGFQQPSLRKL